MGKLPNICMEMSDIYSFLGIGMGMGNLLFNRPCGPRDLESNMKMAKQKFPQLQIIFVIINRKGDPAYGNYQLTIQKS